MSGGGGRPRIASGCLAYIRRTTGDQLSVTYTVPSGSLYNTYTPPSELLVNMRRMRENHASRKGAGRRRPTEKLERRAGKAEHRTSNIEHRTSNIQRRIPLTRGGAAGYRLG